MTNKKKNKGDGRRREILGILIMAFALFVFLGLISHHPSDFPNNGSQAVIQNWLGLAGALISYHLFVFTIGYASIIFPFIFFLLGWHVFLIRPFKPFIRLSFYLISLGLFLSTVLALPHYLYPEKSTLGFQLSGNLGGFFAKQLSHYLGTAGSILFLLTCLLLFLVSATSWSMRESLVGFRVELGAVVKKLVQTKKRRKIIQPPPQNSKKSMQVSPLPVDKKRLKNKPAPEIPERRREQLPQVRMPAMDSKERPAVHEVKPPVTGEYVLPSLDLLSQESLPEQQVDQEALLNKAQFLEERLLEFDIQCSVTGIHPGPVITRFEVKPDAGVKVSRFVSIQDDLALVLQASRVRVVAPIPGKPAVGIEVPNASPAMVSLRGILESKSIQQSSSALTLALGLTIEGHPYVTDLGQLPHLLVAGATGSGKSVCLNTIITSILCRAKPSEIKLVLIDPKMLELALYRKLKQHHLTTCEDLDEVVVTQADNAVSVFRSLVREMEKRYRILAKAGVRDIYDFNKSIKKGRIKSDEEGKTLEPLPFIVLIVDELADLMLTAAKDVEEPIAKLAQMARAVGIHLILATQRPSVDVITGVIKANFPARIAFQVTSKTDSRTILDRNGAEKLLGRGDMLFLNPREPEPIRIHGAFVSMDEVKKIVAHISRQPYGTVYRLPGMGSKDRSQGGRGTGERDELFKEAARLVIRHQQGSASLLQRRLRVGYARAGRLIDELEEAGIVGPYDGSKARLVLVDEGFIERLDDPDFLNNQTIEDE